MGILGHRLNSVPSSVFLLKYEANQKKITIKVMQINRLLISYQTYIYLCMYFINIAFFFVIL
jgi:hypothetical protein